jgi:hypothetical protein
LNRERTDGNIEVDNRKGKDSVMVDWQITATTILCEAVADQVTILVNADWSVKCTGLDKYTKNRQASVELVKRSMSLKRSLDCQGLECPYILEYKQKLMDEEERKASRTGEKK